MPNKWALLSPFELRSHLLASTGSALKRSWCGDRSIPKTFYPANWELRPKPVDSVDNRNVSKLRLFRHVLLSHGASNGPRTIMTLHVLQAAIDPYDAAVEDAIAACNGDLRSQGT
jgi:hypothetical protein